VAFTVLTGMVTAATLIVGVSTVRLLHDAAASTLGKMQASLVVTSAFALTGLLGARFQRSRPSGGAAVDHGRKSNAAAGTHADFHHDSWALGPFRQRTNGAKPAENWAKFTLDKRTPGFLIRTC